MLGVSDLLVGVDVCLDVSVGGFLRTDDGGRPGTPGVGVFDLRFVRDAGLDGGRPEDVLRSFTSGWSEVPLVNEEGGCLLGVFAADFVGVGLAAFDGGLVATEDGPGLVAGEVTVGWGGVFGISMGSGSTGFKGSDSTRVGVRDGGMTSITSAGGEGALSTSGGAPSSEPLASGDVEVFISSENGEAWIIGWTGGRRCPGESPGLCELSRGGQSLMPTLLSFGGEATLELRGGHSLLSLISSLAESPVV